MYTDLLGSPIAGSNGSAYKEHYRPWGEKKDNPIQLSDDVGYTGHQSDIETGLTYMQARYYDPVVGRFMAVDPVGFDGQNPGQFGRFTYANDNSYKNVDPDGRETRNFQWFQTQETEWGVLSETNKFLGEARAQRKESASEVLSAVASEQGLNTASNALAVGAIISIIIAQPELAVAFAYASDAANVGAASMSEKPEQNVPIAVAASIVPDFGLGKTKSVISGALDIAKKNEVGNVALEAGSEASKHLLGEKMEEEMRRAAPK